MPEQRHGETEDHEICDNVDNSSCDNKSLEVDASSGYSWNPHFSQRHTLENITKELGNAVRDHEEAKAHQGVFKPALREYSAIKAEYGYLDHRDSAVVEAFGGH